MPRIKLTDRTLQTLRTDKRLEQFFDSSFAQGCFGVQVTRAGKKTFFLMYRSNGKRKWLSLGAYGKPPLLSLKAARDKAIAALARIHDGKDPAAQKRAYKQSETFRELAEEFIEKRSKERNWPQTTKRDFESMLRRDLYPRWQDTKAVDIRKRDVIDVLESIAYGRGSSYLANRTKELVHAIFSWALKRDMLEYNPAAGIDDFVGEKPRDRYLSQEEIETLWHLVESELNVFCRAFYRFLLIWGLRPGEVMKLKWSYFDADTLLLPSHITKNRRPHALYVPLLANTEMYVLRSKTGDSEYLFPGFRAGDHRHSFATDHRTVLEKMQGDTWQIRDLRRTVETQMTRHGIDRSVVDKILNHGESGITARHYDWHDYFPEKKKALLKWEQVLQTMVEEYGAEQNSTRIVNFPGHALS